jgi:thiol:disulfide interchange protein DsbD
MSKKNKVVLLLQLFFLIIVIGSFAVSQPENHLQISLAKKDLKANAGENFQVHLRVSIDPSWHINSHQPKEDYLIPTLVTATGEGIKLLSVKYPKALDIQLQFSDKPVSVYEGDIEFLLSFLAEPSSYAGTKHIEVQLRYQACNNQTCIAPITATALLEVAVSGSAAKELQQPITPEPPVQKRTADQKISNEITNENPLSSTFEKSGLLVSLLLIFLGGLALNLTPCVYPLIPITIGYFGGQSEGKTSKLFMLGLLYMLGMALTYSIIGVVTSLSGALFGTLLQNIYVIIGIAVMFVILSLSQFGVYEFTLPSSWIAAAGGAKGGTFGAFFMGLTMGIVAAPCIGPFVLGLVTYVAAKGDPFQGFLMFFVLALGLGLPYLVLALFSGKIKQLPRSGEWMEGVKHIFGFLLLAMALYFLNPILPKGIQSAVLPIFGLMSALILLFFDNKGNSVKGFKIFKIVFSLAVIAVAVYALVPSQKNSPDWQNYSDAAFDASMKNQERMILDFYADWCIPCKELDAMTFSDPAVVKESKSFTTYKIDLTQTASESTEKLTARFQIKGVPTVLIINSQGKEVERITGFLKAEEFLKIIRAVQ